MSIAVASRVIFVISMNLLFHIHHAGYEILAAADASSCTYMSNFGIITLLLPLLKIVWSSRKGIFSLPGRKLVVSLDVVIKILENPSWSKKAGKVRTLKEMRQVIMDFCEANGRAITIDTGTTYAYL